MQKNSITILCTAPVREEMIQLAASKNIRLEIIPFIDVRWVDESLVSDKILAYAKQKLTVIFTSVRAVESVMQKLRSQKPDWQIACIAGKTEKKIAGYFGEDRIIA